MRGNAYVELDNFKKGLKDLKKALSVKDDDVTLQDVINNNENSKQATHLTLTSNKST